jgi:cell volume regulation protein A
LDGSVAQALLVSALVIVIGFLGNALFERKGLPDMLFLIVLGYVVGPLLRLFDPLSVAALAPYLAALALVFILFDGGMHMNIRQVISESPRAILLAVLGFFSSLLIIAAFMTYLVGVPLLYGVLFGSIFGGSSSIVVVSLARKISVSEKCSTILTLESAITDILCIVVSLVVIGVILTGHMDYYVVAKDIAARFLIGSFVGIALGLAWLFLLKGLARQPFSYMLTLAVVLFGYTVSEYLGGSGALSSLLFGLVLGNETSIFKALKRERVGDVVVDGGLRRFESEIAFLIRTFFFVFLGLIAVISDLWFVLVGALVSFMLLLARFGVVTLATFKSELRNERPIMSVVLTRGLAAAVLATLPLQYANPEVYPVAGPVFQSLSPLYINLAVIVIVFTAIIATLGAFVLRFARRKT